MRIALVATGGFDQSGRERVIPSLLWLVERLARRHDVFVYVLRYHDTARRYRLAGATVVDLGRPRGLLRQHAATLSQIRADGPFDVVHGYWAHPAGLIAAAIGRRLAIPSIVTCDSGEFVALPEIDYGHQQRVRSRLAVSAAVRLASRVTVCSEYQAQLARAHGVEPSVVPLGVDAALFAHHHRTAAPPFRLLHVASLNPVKDQPTLIRAVHQLVTHLHVDATLDIVGEDTLGGSLHDLVRRLDLESRVTFHGFMPTDALASFYGRADVFILSSRHEAAGVVLLEAALSGVPVVGSAVGYLADWAPDRATAVPPGQPPLLAQAIADLLRDDQRRLAQTTAAEAWARAHDAEWTADAFEALYADLRRHSPGQASSR
jgi:glycosyltransferase involved in cell wall biosynthesis